MKEKVELGIIGAMECEVSLLRESMADIKTETFGMLTFYIGKIGNTTVALARAGEGKVNAAMCAATMISEYAPEAVVNTGCAGSVCRELDRGDMLVADSAVEYDLCYGALGYPDGTIFLPDGSTTVVIDTDAELASALYEAASELGMHTIKGRAASGDRFVSDPELRRVIHDSFGGSVCEMEGAAIAHTCYIMGVPCGILRSVSDNADGQASGSFEEFAAIVAQNSAKILLKYIKNKESKR